MPKFVVSACLAGHRCRYDGGSNPCPDVIRLVKAGLAFPVCPEQLARLPVPRPPCELLHGKVKSRDGRDMTAAFAAGAAEALRLARENGCTAAILKARSPSCGPDGVYDGSFSKRLAAGRGVWARALEEAGFRLYTEERLPSGAEERCGEPAG